jgi:aldehyde:ferredoxin oxidoreductase
MDRYDQELLEIGIEISGLSTDEKVKALRNYREARYEKLVDAVYKRRGWTENGIPTLETVKRLQIDFPEVLRLISK